MLNEKKCFPASPYHNTGGWCSYTEYYWAKSSRSETCISMSQMCALALLFVGSYRNLQHRSALCPAHLPSWVPPRWLQSTACLPACLPSTLPSSTVCWINHLLTTSCLHYVHLGHRNTICTVTSNLSKVLAPPSMHNTGAAEKRACIPASEPDKVNNVLRNVDDYHVLMYCINLCLLKNPNIGSVLGVGNNYMTWSVISNLPGMMCILFVLKDLGVVLCDPRHLSKSRTGNMKPIRVFYVIWGLCNVLSRWSSYCKRSFFASLFILEVGFLASCQEACMSRDLCPLFLQ